MRSLLQQSHYEYSKCLQNQLLFLRYNLDDVYDFQSNNNIGDEKYYDR
jgi:hypothetical protein